MTGPASLAELDVAPGAALLDELAGAIARYAVLPCPEAVDALACWIAASYGQPALEHATRLVVKSPEKRCGKSRVMDLVEAMCHVPLITVNISPAALVRSIAEDPPTLILDEADTVFGKKAAEHEDLRGIINAGHGRNRPYIRWDVSTRAIEHCPTFAMAALACIGDMPDTIEDRAVVIRMRRRAPGETVAPFRQRRDRPALADLGGRTGAWVRAHLRQLQTAEPAMPLEDREADTWESLVAIGDLAGAEWPARIRRAAEVLTAAADSADSLGVRLLADIRAVFGVADSLHTNTILHGLCAIEEAPWRSLRGVPLDPRGLANLLRPYGVRPTTVTIGATTLKGYQRADLHDAWSRYLSVGSVGSVETQVSAPTDQNGYPLGPLGGPGGNGQNGQNGPNGNGPNGNGSGSVGLLTCNPTLPTDPTHGWPEGSTGNAANSYSL